MSFLFVRISYEMDIFRFFFFITKFVVRCFKLDHALFFGYCTFFLQNINLSTDFFRLLLKIALREQNVEAKDFLTRFKLFQIIFPLKHFFFVLVFFFCPMVQLPYNMYQPVKNFDKVRKKTNSYLSA